MDELGINPRILAFMALIGIFIAIAFSGQFLFPKKENPEDNTQIVVIEKEVEILVTPTPDGHLYFATEYQNGTRLLKRPFTWIRHDVLGTMDMKVTTIVMTINFLSRYIGLFLQHTNISMLYQNTENNFV